MTLALNRTQHSHLLQHAIKAASAAVAPYAFFAFQLSIHLRASACGLLAPEGAPAPFCDTDPTPVDFVTAQLTAQH